jgi:peptidyl-Lys metalloendopeptidase
MRHAPTALRAAAALLAVLLAGEVQARGFDGCTKLQAAVADAAVEGAIALAAAAGAAVGDTPDYVRWFGAHEPASADRIRRGFGGILGTLRDPALQVVCIPAARRDCKTEDRDDTFAFVLYDRPRVIHLCPSFFRMPALADARRGLGDKENGTREGTIIHEVSHFPSLAATSDECYSRPVCMDLAVSDPTLARVNADSYQYFAEDVALGTASP